MIQAVSEREYAGWRRGEGHKVIERRGRFWQETFPGFYETVPYLARMTADEAQRPTWRSWGFRAALEDHDSQEASGFMTFFLLRNLTDFGMHSLHPKRRNTLRKCLKTTAVVQLTDASLLRAQGYEVYLSYATRVGVRRPLSHAGYLHMVNQWFEDARRLIIAGILDGHLLGYAGSFAVGPMVYIDQVHVSSSALPTDVSTALYFETLDVCRRSGVGREACSGIYRAENQGLATFKRLMGFDLVKVPIRFQVPKVVEAYLRRRRPDTYHRFYGSSSDLKASTCDDGQPESGKKASGTNRVGPQR
jgi:hypothetical protein